MYFKTKLILFCFLNINLTPVYGDELQFGHVFPECDDVCARFQMSSKPIFSFSIWNVTCQDLFCLVKTRWYSSVIIPSSDPDEFVVDYDISILKLRRRSLDIIPNMEIWMGLLWTDENLQLCDCSGQERQELSMKFWYGDIWLPDVHIYPSYFINRRTFLHQFNNFYLLKQNRTRNGVGVYFEQEFETEVNCRLDFGVYPFERRVCFLKIGPRMFTQRDSMIDYRLNQFSFKKVEFPGFSVQIRRYCKEEIMCDAPTHGIHNDQCRKMDGFKIFIERKSTQVVQLFRSLYDLPVFLAIFSLLLPGNPPKSLGCEKFECIQDQSF